MEISVIKKNMVLKENRIPAILLMPYYWVPTMCLGLHSISVNSHKEVTLTPTLQIANGSSKRENKCPTASHQRPAFVSPTCYPVLFSAQLYFHLQYKCWNWLFLLLKSPLFTPHISPLPPFRTGGGFRSNLPRWTVFLNHCRRVRIQE